MSRVWVGVDVGKEFHWAVVLDAEGGVLLSRRVENDQADLCVLLEEVLALGAEATWAVDQPGGSAALLLALLWERGQRVLYAPGVAVNRARDAHRGESKTDARDARLIAELARMRRDLAALGPGDELLAELKLLVGHRRDLVLDQARAVVRLRDALLKTRAAVAEKLTKAMADRNGGLIFDAANLTVGEYLDSWLSVSVRGTVRPSTFERHEGIIRLHIKPSLGRVAQETHPSARARATPREAGCRPRPRHGSQDALYTTQGALTGCRGWSDHAQRCRRESAPSSSGRDAPTFRSRGPRVLGHRTRRPL